MNNPCSPGCWNCFPLPFSFVQSNHWYVLSSAMYSNNTTQYSGVCLFTVSVGCRGQQTNYGKIDQITEEPKDTEHSVWGSHI